LSPDVLQPAGYFTVIHPVSKVKNNRVYYFVIVHPVFIMEVNLDLQTYNLRTICTYEHSTH
jgi:hypothetical protein